MKFWPELRFGSVMLLTQLRWPDCPATIVPEDPPQLVPGEVPGLGAFVVTATFTAIVARIGNKRLRLEPEGGKLGLRWVIVKVETESTPLWRPIPRR